MTKEIKIGKVNIGGGNAIAIQSMTNLPLSDVDATLQQIYRLQQVGCDLVRVAVPDVKSAKILREVKDNISIPLIADVHFNRDIAIAALENGADKIRVNPGNVATSHLAAVIDCAKSHGAAIRIGVNGGSVEKSLFDKYNGDKPEAMAESLLAATKFFEKRGFYDIVLSVKSSNVAETVALNRKIASICDYPLHIGVTEAGLRDQALVKNAIGIGSLLLDGIGDTIRVSMTADPVEEVIAAKEILTAVGLRQSLQFVSCPKCGRCKVDLEGVAKLVYDSCKDIDLPLKIAVMGCEVNGPGECADADLGLAGGDRKFAFFKKGKVYKTVDETNAVDCFVEEIRALAAERKNK